MKYPIIAAFSVGAMIGVGCLPGDIRPHPGRVYMTVEGSSSANNGFTTDDGWAIHFDKLLVGLGFALFSGDTCNVYGDARYSRLFDFTLPGAQKLADIYALNDCDLQFHLVPPLGDVYLGNGVTKEDRESMAQREIFWFKAPTFTSVYVHGNAAKGDIVEQFDWKFSARYTLTDCANADEQTTVTSLHLKSDDDLRPVIEFHAEDLFLDSLEAGAGEKFDFLAAADKNADGQLTLAEMAKIPAPVDDTDIDAGIVDGGPVGSVIQGWARFMRRKLLPHAFHFDGRPCKNVPGKTIVDNLDIDLDL